jgi:hydrogenase expression/formation protein HypD
LKFLDEYRDAELVLKYAAAVKKTTTRPWTLMEICGGQTHTIVKYGLDGLLPDTIELIHGPGCPVCVTPIEKLDKAMELASRPNIIFCTFGDMLRVPGSEVDLLSVKARGGQVRTVYGPMDALKIARDNPDQEVVFFGVGFETTAPAIALTIHTAREQKVENFSVLVSHVLVPPAMKALLGSPTNRVQGFLAAGHVCTVMGYWEYEPIAETYKVPIVVTGFEPADILQGVLMCVQQLEAGEAKVENQYTRSVRQQGNEPAQELIGKVFTISARNWRGIGEIPESGLVLRPEYSRLDAEIRFDLGKTEAREAPECISGLILQGVRKPNECSEFGTRCTPERPLGAPMVSSEGACAAYYRYRRFGGPGIMKGRAS